MQDMQTDTATRHAGGGVGTRQAQGTRQSSDLVVDGGDDQAWKQVVELLRGSPEPAPN